MDKKATDLHRIIFTTERSRIKAEARLKFYETAGQLLTTYYSVLLVILAVFQSALRQRFHFVDEATIALSVIVLAFTIAISGFRFGQKADLYKASYHKMQRLRGDLSRAKGERISEINSQYVDVLDSSPNHDDRDYHDFLVERWIQFRKSDEMARSPSWLEIVGYAWRLAIRWLFVLFFWLAPLAVAVWIYHVW